MTTLVRKKIGEVLAESGLITQQQLDHALMLQKGKNKRVGRILVELGYATEDQIAKTLAQQLSLPYVDCSEFTITDSLKTLIPKDVAERELVMPLEIKDKSLVLAMANPLDLETIDEIAFRTGLKIVPVVTEAGALISTIERFYGDSQGVWELLHDIGSQEKIEFIDDKEKAEEQISAELLYESSTAAPIVKLVTMLVTNAVRSRSSDVHIEPRDKYIQVRYRIDGELRDVHKFPKHIQDSVISRIKIISNLDITNRKLPQDGSAHMKFDHREIDLRISTLPSIYGEKVVIRVLDRTVGLIPLTSLGIPDAILKKLIETFNQSQGMLLVTGPTGSGKTTTLYACINQLRSEAENIVTVEDPVEYKLEGITQVSVNEAIGYGFSTALRSILRQDPDIILVGEIRDVETAEIAIRSALTGHLVLSTLHTNDTIATITRLIDIGVPEFLVSSSVTGILAQRLVRKTCEFCKTEIEPRLDMYNAPFPSLQRAYKGKGCARCFYTGYYGQTGVYEFLKLTTKLKRMVARKAPESELREAAEEEGFNSLFRDAWAKVQEGLTTIEEVLGKIPFPSGHEYAVKTEDEKTIDELVESYKKDPANVSIIERLADMYKKAGNFGEAAGMYLQMLEFDNTRSDTHYGLGKIYLEMGMIDKAIEHIKRAWGLSPSSQEITDCLKELSKSYRITI